MEKKFDAVAWMRMQRARIDEEDQGLSWEQKRRKTRHLLEKDPLWQRLRYRIVNPVEIPSVAVGEPRESYGVDKHRDSDEGNNRK
jgi:hypothetical protein